MTEEVKAHLFEPFFTTKGVGKGTGLGLATCYGIINQIGGRIEVCSELGQGTTIKFYLPIVNDPVSPPQQHQIPNEVPHGSETILLAEDEPLVRSMASKMLKGQGYIVLEAPHGEAALRVARQHVGEGMHLLLTDVVMPKMGGIELSEKVKALYPNCRMLLMSGYSDEIVTKSDLLNNGAGFLQKPFTLSSLAIKIREALRRIT